MHSITNAFDVSTHLIKRMPPGATKSQGVPVGILQRHRDAVDVLTPKPFVTFWSTSRMAFFSSAEVYPPALGGGAAAVRLHGHQLAPLSVLHSDGHVHVRTHTGQLLNKSSLFGIL